MLWKAYGDAWSTASGTIAMASDLAKAMDIPKDLLIVTIPTHDMRAVVQSLIELGVVSQLLQRPIHFVVSEGSNIPRARNTILQRVQHTFPHQDAMWVLWLDSDRHRGGHQRRGDLGRSASCLCGRELSHDDGTQRVNGESRSHRAGPSYHG